LNEMFRNFLRVAAPSIAVVVVTLLGLFLGTYVQYVLCLALIASIVGASLVLLVGLGRVIMLATGAMIAIGAYTSTLLVEHLFVPYLIAVIFGAVVGALGGLVLAIPAIRFRGHNLAMVTLVFQAVAVIGIRELPGTGGSEGIRVKSAEILGHPFTQDYEYLLLIGVCGAVLTFFLSALQQGHFGRSLKAIAATEIGSEAYGVHINVYRVVTFAIASGCLAFAGGLLAPRLRILDPETFGILASVNALAYPIVGGMTSVWGGLIGGGLLSIMPEVLRPLAEYKAFIFAALVIAVMISFPGGIVEMASRLSKLLWSTVRRGLGQRSNAKQIATHMFKAQDVGPSEQPTDVSRSYGEPSAALKIDSVSISFGNLRAVNGVSLVVNKGAIHGLIGPNGAGKTSLFNLISGFLIPDSGSISFFGDHENKAPPRTFVGKGIVRTFQHVAIYGALSCMENVVLGLGHNGIAQSLRASLSEPFRDPARALDRHRAAEALSLVGLVGKETLPANSLSLGDQRRLEIARAIVSRPRLLLLDEPMSGVSLEEEHKLLALLRDLNSRLGLTMFLIEHNIRFVLDICNKLSVMSAGEVLAEGVPAEVIANPEVRRIYFGVRGREEQ
jgi:branched-chain amino acid transport system permease protein